MKRFVRFELILAILLWMAGSGCFGKPAPSAPLPTPFPSPAPVAGAAVDYNRAFEALPKLSDEERKMAFRPMSPKLEEAEREPAAKALDQFGPALDLLAQGAREPTCEWGIDLNQGATMPHLGPGIKCIQALSARARLRMDAGQSEAAVDDLLTGLRFSRDLQQPSLWICLMVRSSLESVLLSTGGRELAKLDASSLERLEQGIHALPAVVPFSESVELKRRFLRKAIYDYSEKCKAEGKEGKSIGETLYKDELSALKKASRGKLDSWIDAVQSDYLAIEEASRHPFPEAQRKIDAISGKKNQNPLEVMVLPSIFGVYEKTIRSQAVWSVFLAALDARLRHPGEERARVGAVTDPFTGEPVKVQEVPGGIEVVFGTDSSKPPLKLTLLLDSGQPAPTP